MTASSLHLPTQLDPAIEARMLVAQAGGTRVSRGWTIGATADICGLDHDLAEAWVDHACTIGLLDRNDATLRLGARLRPLVTWPMVATRTDVAVADDQRRVMCGDRVLAGQWSGVVAAQHGPFSWVVIDGIHAPQTHATITLRPVENSDGE